MKATDLTQLEISRVTETFNLTDGHTTRPLNVGERAIIGRMTDIFLTNTREMLPELESAYVEAFYGLAKQTVNTNTTKYLFLQSASLSLEIVANYLRMNGLSLALTEPCFDNLANMFLRHNVPLESIDDKILDDEANFEAMLHGLKSDAICIVSPNNPTGISYTKNNFIKLVEHCKKHKKLLILDATFRMYKPRDAIFDEFALLQASGIDYIVIEDTGKTWPTKELKVSILAVAENIYKPIFDIYSDFIYHHSSFIFALLTEFIRNSAKDDLKSVHDIVRVNRQQLWDTVEGTILAPEEKKHASVSWLRIDKKFTETEVEEALSAAGVYILPGHLFYWSGKKKGSNYIRVSLVRDEAVFAAAMKKMRQALLKMSNG